MPGGLVFKPVNATKEEAMRRIVTDNSEGDHQCTTKLMLTIKFIWSRIVSLASALLFIPLAACIFSIEPVLDETNSVPAEASTEFREFLEAWHFAFGTNTEELFFAPDSYFIDKDGNVDLSSIRVADLKDDTLLVQQEIEPCISGHCFVYYKARMIEPWWPDNCVADTGDALSSLADENGVVLTVIGDDDKYPRDYGLTAKREDALRFLEGVFTDGPTNCTSDEGATPLHWAAGGLSRASVPKLIEAGADVNARFGTGATPLHMVAYEVTDLDAALANIKALLDAGADVGAVAEEHDCGDLTPLHLRSRSEASDEIVAAVSAALIDAGANINARASGEDCAGMTPLHFAARARLAKTFAVLLDLGADGSLKDDAGRTPFDFED